MKVERRIATRFTTSVPVGIRFPEGSVKESWGRILNLSPEGLLVQTLAPLKVAGVIYVTFTLKDGVCFENLRARVIRCGVDEGYTLAGIAFDDVVDKETLGDVIAGLANEGGLLLS